LYETQVADPLARIGCVDGGTLPQVVEREAKSILEENRIDALFGQDAFPQRLAPVDHRGAGQQAPARGAHQPPAVERDQAIAQGELLSRAGFFVGNSP
jgi:hypothetical protein